MRSRAPGQRGLGAPIADATHDRATDNARVPAQDLWARANPSQRDVRRSLAPLTIEETAGEAAKRVSTVRRVGQDFVK